MSSVNFYIGSILGSFLKEKIFCWTISWDSNVLWVNICIIHSHGPSTTAAAQLRRTEGAVSKSTSAESRTRTRSQEDRGSKAASSHGAAASAASSGHVIASGDPQYHHQHCVHRNAPSDQLLIRAGGPAPPRAARAVSNKKYTQSRLEQPNAAGHPSPSTGGFDSFAPLQGQEDRQGGLTKTRTHGVGSGAIAAGEEGVNRETGLPYPVSEIFSASSHAGNFCGVCVCAKPIRNTSTIKFTNQLHCGNATRSRWVHDMYWCLSPSPLW